MVHRSAGINRYLCKRLAGEPVDADIGGGVAPFAGPAIL